MVRRFAWSTVFAALIALALPLQTHAQGNLRITGALSNFDCTNNTGDDCSGFDIEIEGCHKEDITGTWPGSAFGGPTVEDIGTASAPRCRVHYSSPTAVVPNGGVTHFGVHLSTFVAPGKITYTWLPATYTGLPPQPLPLPTHQSQLVTNGGVKSIQNGIKNDQPDNGMTFWILPYRNVVKREVELDELMPNTPLIQGSQYLGDGLDGRTPIALSPQDTWTDDDAVEDGATNSVALSYQIYADDNGQPGTLLCVMMDATVSGTSAVQPSALSIADASVYGGYSTIGTVSIQGAAPLGGAVITLSSKNAAASVPTTVIISENQSSASFAIPTVPVTATTNVTITAASGNALISSPFTVKAPDAWYIGFNPWTVIGGLANSTGTAQITSPAPTGGTVVTLTSANPAIVQVPASVTIPEGQTSVTFTATTTHVAAKIKVGVSATAGTLTQTQALQVLPAPNRVVSGMVSLDSVVNAKQSLTFTFRPSDGSADIVRQQTLLADPNNSAQGSFAFNNIPAGNYTLHIKGSKWLASNLAVNVTSGNLTGISANLLGGDADNNNTVDFDDLTILAIAYNTAQGDGSGLYDDRADFNCDGQVEFADLTILAINYNLSGDP